VSGYICVIFMRFLLVKCLAAIFCSQCFGGELEGEWRVDVERAGLGQGSVCRYNV